VRCGQIPQWESGRREVPDVIAETDGGKYRLGEAKGKDTGGAVEQFQAAGKKPGADNIKY
jgi:hypothetical protein